jgi:hypothetical protein
VAYISIAPQWGTRAASPLHCLAAHLFVRALRPAAAALALLCLAVSAASAGPGPIPIADFDATWQEGRWAFSSGPEFPGARGTFTRSKDAAASGRFGGRLDFDFSGGGNYVGALLDLADAPRIGAVRLRVLKPDGNRLTFRYTDQTGQTLQRGFWAPAGRWVEPTIPMSGWSIHWGGADDGVVHGPPQRIAFLIENTGRQRGALLIDDVRLVPGEPGEAAGMIESEYVAAEFGPDEGWWMRVNGMPGRCRLDGRDWTYDFTQGAGAVGVLPAQFSLLGDPQEIRIRVRGSAPGHPVRLQISTHFMTFDRSIGEFNGPADGVSEIVVQAPPSEGWRWFGGENDGKRHGPLCIRGIYLEAGDRRDSGTLELLDLRVRTRVAPDRTCVLTAAFDEQAHGFVATVRTVLEEEVPARLSYAVRDWQEQVLAEGDIALPIPPSGRPTTASVPLPEGKHAFVEAEFVLEAPNLLMPAVQACRTERIQRLPDSTLEPESPFGMGVYLYRYPSTLSGVTDMATAAAMASAAGVKWSREEFHWARIEPRKGAYDWAFYDRMVETALSNGISVYGLLAYWTPWTKPYTEEGIDDYCRFAAAAAARYRGRIKYWEVWNEPNIFFWQGPRDMYAELLKRAYAAIKQANPDAVVLGCSTSGIDMDFIRRTMELGAPFDAVSVHPYRPNLADDAFIGELREVAEAVRLPDGTARPVWITEMGWATYLPRTDGQAGFVQTTERDQACRLARTYIDAIASGVVTDISWYDFRNDGTDPFDAEHNLGIITRGFRPKAAYRAYATLTQMLAGCAPEGRMDLGEGAVGFRFGHPGGGTVIALWATDDPQEVDVPWEGPAVVTDLMGSQTRGVPGPKGLRLGLQPGAPVFVEAPDR